MSKSKERILQYTKTPGYDILYDNYIIIQIREHIQQMDKCKIIYRGGEGEIEEKKSRFIACILPIASEEEAAAFINARKKEYWDARHNCSAYVLGENQELTRCSDDGEPSGTAGRPMLEVLLREEIHNAAVVVTRYFGGTLLGTGGLVRAYQAAVQEGLRNCTLAEKIRGRLLSIATDYNGLGKLQYLLAGEGIPIREIVYGQDVQIETVVPAEHQQRLEKLLTNASSGKAVLDWKEMCSFAVIDDEVKLL